MNSYNGFTAYQRQKAYTWWKGEVAAGRRQLPTKCDACGQTEGRLECHDEDYSEPYGDHICQFNVCYLCHMMIHCRPGNPKAWEAYIRLVEAGWRFKPVGRDFRAVRTILGYLPQHFRTDYHYPGGDGQIIAMSLQLDDRPVEPGEPVIPHLLVDITAGRYAPGGDLNLRERARVSE